MSHLSATLGLAGIIGCTGCSSLQFGVMENRNFVEEYEMIPSPISSNEMHWSKYEREEDVARIIEIADEDYTEIIRKISDPVDAAIYCTFVLHHGGDNYDDKMYGEDYWASFRETAEKKVGDCDDGALAAAALLTDNGFPLYLLQLHSKEKYVGGMMTRRKAGEEGHMVFLYKTIEGDFGSLGINPSDCQMPVQSLQELIDNISLESGHDYELGRIRRKLRNDFADNCRNNRPEFR